MFVYNLNINIRKIDKDNLKISKDLIIYNEEVKK